MVDQSVWGRIALSRARGRAGKLAALQILADYISRKIEMPLDILKPIIAMPIISMAIQAVSPYIPISEQVEKWGPFAVVAGWLMWRETRQMRMIEHYIRALDKRADKQTEVLEQIKHTLAKIESRPCIARDSR